MREYDVVSVALTKDGSYGTKNGELLVRTERIDTQTNDIFTNCNTKEEIKDAYEAFWALDKWWVNGQCKVVAVVPVVKEREIID